VLNYSGIKKDKIMFVSPEGVMKIYDSPEALSNAVGSEINITRFSDFAPRLAFKDPENDISKQSDEPAIEKEVQEIKIRDKEDIKNISGTQYISKRWYDNHPTYQTYFDDKAPTTFPNFIPLKAEYKDTVKLVSYTSLEEELTNYLIKSLK
jgi:hypothetical protein